MANDPEWPTSEWGVLDIPDTDDAVTATHEMMLPVPDTSQESLDYNRGFADGYCQAQYEYESDPDNGFTNITDESHDRAAKFLYFKDGPTMERDNAWSYAGEHRREIYRRSAEMIARMYIGWPV